ncbi:kinase-like protein [Polyplosphaeria fusca]|uniref:Kinase-like protein n=1 Tax=Polyplosphaeria fusca TaxID=682080 RepID=A0A9P4V7Y5_9PLEO|nr:kinase-like protein [Polyplosphaeria fusca]
MLARKRIRCSRRMKKEDVVKEAVHLRNLSYSHVVRGVGTYTLGEEVSILLYPAANYNLEAFLEECHIILSITAAHARMVSMLRDLRRFFQCITRTIHFVHTKLVKHMDIKPSNFLVHKRAGAHYTHDIFPTDFGISRSYDNIEEVETDSATACTRNYAAPEVVRQETRGFGADILSLGCVLRCSRLCVLRCSRQN